jgi:two-component system, NtrC family, response regulator HydG
MSSRIPLSAADTAAAHRAPGDRTRAAVADTPAGGEILVLNRDPEVRSFLNRALFSGNFSSTSVNGPEEAKVILRRGGVAMVLLGVEDSITPEQEALISQLAAERPELPVVAVGSRPPADLVRQVLLRGLRDFILDPLDAPALTRRLKELMPIPRDPAGEDRPSDPVEVAAPAPAERAGARERRGPLVEPNIIAKNPRMVRVLEIADQIAPTDSTVLIQGESGTGKEVVAKRIHLRSGRCEQPFVEVNCGALPENLLESQLFGHEKGSFTGASHRQAGLFEIADRGTIFLDEIGEMGLDMQVKLLRVLQNHEFRRIGGSQTLKVNVRVIAATNKDLKAEVEKKRFRPDLYYRLNVIALEIPPLRERLEEVPDLIDSFNERLLREKGIARKEFSPEAVSRLQKCRWLGNVRELENAVERLVLLATSSQVEASDVEEHLADDAPLDSPFAATMTLDEVKRVHIAAVLKENRGNKMKTARLLGINVKTLYNLIKSLNIPLES